MSRPRGMRGPGRPPLNRYVRGRQAGNAHITAAGMEPPRSVPNTTVEADANASSANASSAQAQSALTNRERLQLSVLAQTGIDPIPRFSHHSYRGSLPLFLDRITRLPPLWKLVGKIPTLDLPNWFDSQASYYVSSLSIADVHLLAV